MEERRPARSPIRDDASAPVAGAPLGPGAGPVLVLDPRGGAAPDSGSGTGPVLFPEDDFDFDAQFEWLVREIDEGRVQPPPESVMEGPAISVSLGDACDVDPALLVAMCGPGGLGGEALSAAFGQDQAADVLRPGPLLAALTERAVSDAAALTDNELTGVLQAARRVANLAAWQQTMAIAEFARRRQAQFEAARAAEAPVGCRDGEFPGEELAMELVDTSACAGTRIDTAVELTTRLPCTLAGMADGVIDLGRAMTIAARTRVMTDADAAHADAVLAAVAPGLRPDQLARKAAALELKLAPEAVKARKELARHLDQRVEARREESGNASLAGRELDTADVIASKAHIDAIAVKLRNSGLIEGTLAHLRALALIDLTQGRNPLDRITPPVGNPATAPSNPATIPASPATAPANDTGGAAAEPPGNARRPAPATGPPPNSAARGEPAPVPALINLLVPVGTLLGWDTAPGQAAGWGLLDREETRALIEAAARHPRTRWCTTVIAPDGTAIAHGCAAGQHPWPPGPRPRQAAKLADLLRRLDVNLEPIARDTCDHRNAESRYVPSRKLKHLLRARNQTCTAPACNAQAVYCDIDHTIPYPDGPTDQCNTNPKCRRHHRTKQAPGWEASQPAPDTSTWTTPSGRSHSTRATVYDV